MLNNQSVQGNGGPARVSGLRRQAGMTLIESMIALGLSMFVTSAMVVLMSNSLGTASKVIQMTQLTDELRNTMSMLSRDLRRANYSANAAYCYANSDCGIDGSATQSPDITIVNNSCVTFNLDRNRDGNASTDDAGAFRRRVVNGVGLVEMWIGNSSPNCAASNANWVGVTDPSFVDVTRFNIDDSDSFVISFPNEDGSTVNQRSRRVVVEIQGRLVRENSITRTIQDEIKVRNDLISKV
ncbi:PilW family protein [Elongatibacter sediminis]|uniref:Prepilin-type N-terminal cleavage/methylation domain-containing protein n=1 Tax=Elongatibacter sediminis TaxID=3119006 RepID=A0AAW9RFM8_9GAMM